MSVRSRLLYAVKAGYRVLADGSVVGPSGRTLKTRGSWCSGYPSFGVNDHGKMGYVLVHQLVAYLKYGNSMFEEGVEVRHKNGDLTDYSSRNILLGTHSENMMDLPRQLRVDKAKHAAKKLRKLTSAQAEQLRADRRAGAPYKELMAKYGLSKSAVSYVVNEKTYQ